MPCGCQGAGRVKRLSRPRRGRGSEAVVGVEGNRFLVIDSEQDPVLTGRSA